jgi:hypothetical protein
VVYLGSSVVLWCMAVQMSGGGGGRRRRSDVSVGGVSGCVSGERECVCKSERGVWRWRSPSALFVFSRCLCDQASQGSSSKGGQRHSKFFTTSTFLLPPTKLSYN